MMRNRITAMINKTPFIFPADAEAKAVEAVLAKTSGHGLFGAATKARVPFAVPEGFFEDQYAQILAKKGSKPVRRLATSWALRPAMAAIAVACICLLIGLQPNTSDFSGNAHPDALAEWVLPNSPADLDHLLEESDTQSTEHLAPSTFDDETIF